MDTPEHKHPKVTRIDDYRLRQQADVPDAPLTPFERVIEAADAAFHTTLGLATEDPAVRTILLPLLANLTVGLLEITGKVRPEDAICGDCQTDLREPARDSARLLQVTMRQYVESLPKAQPC